MPKTMIEGSNLIGRAARLRKMAVNENGYEISAGRMGRVNSVSGDQVRLRICSGCYKINGFITVPVDDLSFDF